MAEIRRCASTNPSMARQKALSVVRTRKMAARFSNMQSQLQEVSARILNIKSTEALENALTSTNQAIKSFATRLDNGRTLAQTLREFEKNSTSMTLQNEMTDEILDTAFDDEHEEEAGDIINSVLMEAGVTMLPTPPKQFQVSDEELDIRLQRLKVPANSR